MMEELMSLPQSRNVDPSHAFYLGFELAKALTALTLNKRYEQDEALRWGMHTRPEKHHRLARAKRHSANADPSPLPNASDKKESESRAAAIEE
jgi:hypothetical protein